MDSAKEFLLLFVEVKSIIKLETRLPFSSAGFVAFFDRGSTPEPCLSGLFSNASSKGFLVILRLPCTKRYFRFCQVQTVLLVLVKLESVWMWSEIPDRLEYACVFLLNF